MSDQPGVIAVDYAAMEEAQAGIQRKVSELEQRLNDLKGRLAKLEWDGSDRDAYQAAWDKIARAVNDVKDTMGFIGGAVGQTRQSYQDTESANAKRFQ
ncbi:WXG100 family type VII secretion target [Catellatospora tritici]|uniref:WXG100 family type VII secretion target n=1 Tax=Catellatospora tritici TaxID=2851566 RepID=UPI001C2D3E3F|nr:WXG100 family type VII secretion target [Catellatospora tritici]MBV1853545.1 WXG100 family type VII secretion target [Catellatospora tritici]